MSAAASDVQITERPGGIELTVKVVPGASRDRIMGSWGAALRVAVSAPPQAGRANNAVLKLLASTFGVERRAVGILSGQTQVIKRVGVSGLNAAQARAVLKRVLHSQ
jgi:uncharacterized protein (TIGR00251 family)